MDKKKYPFIKAIFNRKKRFECVYAGPEKKPDPGTDAEPEKMPTPDMKPGPMEGVYAGPGFGLPMSKVYAGPRPKPRGGEAEFEDVYAGPEFFGRGQDEPEEAEDVEEAEEAVEEAPEKAAPKNPDFPDRPVPAPFMCVYAGPDYFSNRPSEAPRGVFIPNGDTKPARFCENCGSPVLENAKFCQNCGTPLTREV